MKTPALPIVCGLGLAMLAAACDNGPRLGQINLRLTDAPPAAIGSATIWVSRVYLVGGAGDSAGGQGITVSDTPAVYDLLALQGGVTAALGSTLVPVGDYEQLRLVVDSARVTLAGGITFADGSTSKTLKTPSGGQSGLKVNFGGPIHVAPGQTDLVVDFDVSRNFVLTGPDSAPTGVLFKPVLHASVMDLSGSISGTSSPASAGGRVYAILGTDTVTSALADPVTGAYTLWYLPAGTYTVADSAAGFTTGTQSVVLGASQHLTGIDFTLTP